jgi:Putative amidoligase enzyme
MDRMGARIGFELEFIGMGGRDEIITQLHRELGIRVQSFFNSYRNWYLTYDGSVVPDFRGWNEIGEAYELVSPIMSLEKGLKTIKEMFAWMNRRRHYTNASCGFHVGVSFSSRKKMGRLNLDKLVILFDEKRILTQFQRNGNDYCLPHKEDTDFTISKVLCEDGIVRNALIPEYMPAGAITSFSRDKFRSINLGKYRGSDTGSYLEFRAIGGRNYHKKYQKIKAAINHYVRIMDWASESNKGQAAFQRELERLR